MEKNREEQRQEQIGQKSAADDSESRLNDQDPGERQKEKSEPAKGRPAGCLGLQVFKRQSATARVHCTVMLTVCLKMTPALSFA
jgi:hypothetical protein